jgi:hypothetical protein
MSATLIHKGPAYELTVTIDNGRYGHHLKFNSVVPTARHPEPHVKFQANLSAAELNELHQAIARALAGLPVHTSRSSGEPVDR